MPSVEMVIYYLTTDFLLYKKALNISKTGIFQFDLLNCLGKKVRILQHNHYYKYLLRLANHSKLLFQIPIQNSNLKTYTISKEENNVHFCIT